MRVQRKETTSSADRENLYKCLGKLCSGARHSGWLPCPPIDAVQTKAEQCEGDERTGVRILRRALGAPTRQIAENSGADSGGVVERMRTSTGNDDYDAARNTYVDLVEAGIIDPTKVVRTALENAVSVASLLRLTEGTLTEVEDRENGRTASFSEDF
jgi:chaperonin GroEL